MEKQTFFESEHALENAEVMLDLCREEYERAGRMDDALALRGLDVKSSASAHLALLVVRNIPEVDGLIDVRRFTVKAVAQACNHFRRPQRVQLLAS